MAITLTLTQTRDMTPESEYRVLTTATSTEMPSEVFVHLNSGAYSHVASVRDMIVFPTVPTPTVGFYRRASVVQVFDDVKAAAAAADAHKHRVAQLVDEYIAATTAFLGSDVVTYPPEG